MEKFYNVLSVKQKFVYHKTQKSLATSAVYIFQKYRAQPVCFSIVKWAPVVLVEVLTFGQVRIGENSSHLQ